MKKTLKQILLENGVSICDIDSHCSDLYCKKTPITEKIIEKYQSETGVKATNFVDHITGTMWYDVPFGCFDEYFHEAKNRF